MTLIARECARAMATGRLVKASNLYAHFNSRQNFYETCSYFKKGSFGLWYTLSYTGVLKSS